MASVLGSQPLSSLGSAAAFVDHPRWISLSFVMWSPSMWGLRGKPGVWIQEEEAYSCLGDLSVHAFRCPMWLGTSPGWAITSRGLAGTFVRRWRRSHAQPHCIFLVSKLSWKKTTTTKKTPTPTRLPDFDSPAQPMLVEASGAGLLVTSRCTRAWPHPECRKGLCGLLGVGGLFTEAWCFSEMLCKGGE